ncbi:MAG: hypothetical protein Q7R83_04125 [bacterium]|nr:hypothetical protein [bacterium]
MNEKMPSDNEYLNERGVLVHQDNNLPKNPQIGDRFVEEDGTVLEYHEWMGGDQKMHGGWKQILDEEEASHLRPEDMGSRTND